MLDHICADEGKCVKNKDVDGNVSSFTIYWTILQCVGSFLGIFSLRNRNYKKTDNFSRPPLGTWICKDKKYKILIEVWAGWVNHEELPHTRVFIVKTRIKMRYGGGIFFFLINKLNTNPHKQKQNVCSGPRWWWWWNKTKRFKKVFPTLFLLIQSWCMYVCMLEPI